MRKYLIVVDDVSPTTTPEILPAICDLRWDFPEEERMMQYSRDKYFPQLRTKVINPVGEPSNNSLAAPAHKQQILATQCIQGVINPSTVASKNKLYVLDR